ncbi:MAG: pyruvate dehydrogenase (acetyl-transferring) E1 component subunit alpha [Alphaproteobacteria bacterium]
MAAAPKATKKKTTTKKSSKKQVPSAETSDDLLTFYRDMLLIRRFEEKAGQLYGMGLIGGFCHLYIGQEAVIVGTMAAAGEGDQFITGYRDHGHMLACGISPDAVMAELTGRADGQSKGKGGSMHMFSREKEFYGGHGIVGAQVPIGTGLAFANKYNDSDAVSITFFGDGAANQGQVYESFNMAELWQLPVLYVIENNQYAMGTSVGRASSQPDLHKRGESFSIPGRMVDGMDVFAVRDAVAEALTEIRAGGGPILLEMSTYRYRGHSMSDPAKYRTKDEVNKVKAEHDPIDRLRERIFADGAADEAGVKEIDSAVKDVVLQAAEFAKESPEPDPSELMTDILVEG